VRQQAEAAGLRFARIESLNTSLAAVVTSRISDLDPVEVRLSG
jgi:hypothetical protein